MLGPTIRSILKGPHVLLLAVCLGGLTGWCSTGVAADDTAVASTARPNVIIVLTDDQGYGDLSCHGNPVLKTPNLDRLHAESVRLTDFHVAPMCTPTRAELMTGIDALRSGAMNVSSGRTLLRRDLRTMADVFAADGYRTGIFGKWHLGDTYPYRPKDRGFQDSLCFRSGYIGAAADAWNNDYFNDRYRFDDELRQVEGYCTDVFFQRAIEWIKQRHNKNGPFFAYIPTNAPHAPLYVPERYRKHYEELLADRKLGKRYRRALARFFGMIANIDEGVGRLEQVLEETGLRDNTILIYLTDNGGTVGVRFYNAGMKGSKMQLWEGGHRVPCFVRWPAAGIGGGRDVKALAEAQDWLPTLVDLCGLRAPERARLDGTSLAGLLRGSSEPPADRTLVVQYSRMDLDRLHKGGGRPHKDDAAVMWKQWRLLRGKELYDLTTDPHQDKNIIEEHPDIAARLQKHYDRWWAEIEPTLDTYQPSVIGSDQQNPTRLCSCEWADERLDQSGQVRRGVRRNGTWHVEAEQPGEYEFALRRWPREVTASMTEGTPPHHGEDCRYAAGKALPIAKARLRVGQHDLTGEVKQEQREAVFTATLPKGRTTVQTWFYDADGKEICGAYYVYVKRVRDQ